MTAVPLNPPAGVVTLDGSGNGTARLGPISAREVWQVATASVRVATANAEATCQIYVGPDTGASNFRDQTFTGSSGDSTDRVAGRAIVVGEYVWAVWTGGDPGAQAYLTISGTKDLA